MAAAALSGNLHHVGELLGAHSEHGHHAVGGLDANVYGLGRLGHRAGAVQCLGQLLPAAIKATSLCVQTVPNCWLIVTSINRTLMISFLDGSD